jgi:hypothetical protein
VTRRGVTMVDAVPHLPYACRVVIRALSIFTRLVAIALLLAIPLAQVARGAMIAGDVHCCCGVHDADDPCGCPDCPAGPDHDDDDDGDGDAVPHATSFRACGGEGHELSVGAFPLFILPAIATAAPVAHTVLATPPLDAASPAPLIDRSIVPS